MAQAISRVQLSLKPSRSLTQYPESRDPSIARRKMMQITTIDTAAPPYIAARECEMGKLYRQTNGAFYLRSQKGMVNLDIGSFYSDEFYGSALYILVPPGRRFTIENEE
jgi:hypothetical protein